MKKTTYEDRKMEISQLFKKYGIVGHSVYGADDIIISIRSALAHHYPVILVDKAENRYFLFFAIDEKQKKVGTIGQFGGNELTRKYVTFDEIYQMYEAMRQWNLGRIDSMLWEYYKGAYK